MTMVKREPNNIWSRVREDRDIDDLIIHAASGDEQSRHCSSGHIDTAAAFFPADRGVFLFCPGKIVRFST